MNVYEAAQQRMHTIFNEFDNIYVSFSGGKDSGVLLNLCIQYMRQHNITKKIGVFHLDYEAQYESTTQYVDEVLATNSDIIEVFRCCVSFKTPTSTSMHESYWRPWEESKQDIWVRELPGDAMTKDTFDFYNDDMYDYDFQESFSTWYHQRNNAKRTCCLVGIRTQESLNRWRAIHSDRNNRKYKRLPWTKEMSRNIYNAYPIFDWQTSDVWIANAKYKWSYNKLYDLYYMAGVPVEKMRVASPFISQGQDALKLYRIIEPHTWGKLLSRVNGVNFTSIYGGTTAMGWKSITLPKNHTWESYMHFLLNTLPPDTRDNYLSKLQKSIQFWKDKGGCLSTDVIEKLKHAGINITVMDDSNYQTTKKPVRMDYLDDIDISEFQEIPTYKRMCVCILKNDHHCKYMGFSRTKKEVQTRNEIMTKYKSLL